VSFAGNLASDGDILVRIEAYFKAKMKISLKKYYKMKHF
jgi:hypothetical protein